MEDGTGGQLNADIARTVVRIYRRFRGRGPTAARAFFRDDILVVMLTDVMTVPERSLAAAGGADETMDIQRQLRAVMGAELEAAVEQLTGTRVIARMSQNSQDPDMAVEVFVLSERLQPA